MSAKAYSARQRKNQLLPAVAGHPQQSRNAQAKLGNCDERSFFPSRPTVHQPPRGTAWPVSAWLFSDSVVPPLCHKLGQASPRVNFARTTSSPTAIVRGRNSGFPYRTAVNRGDNKDNAARVLCLV
ncbi:uncharacterized protein SPSK_10483 [Sporothrix schenckii 1099-18]|uniref:Uncharacterized protein n=1 Tax=Sporothrix schenckii 1099-18 TaxID=1397361 RepID=A0A0F2MA04_SPOSC|nr:uncharacterized protein SPSK_10483 [Sporothrix schenckii 1099-18]KJR86518.1 hypothetical protein SPSK_10483 [Sporothrix schenckii 1099-18]